MKKFVVMWFSRRGLRPSGKLALRSPICVVGRAPIIRLPPQHEPHRPRILWVVRASCWQNEFHPGHGEPKLIPIRSVARVLLCRTPPSTIESLRGEQIVILMPCFGLWLVCLFDVIVRRRPCNAFKPSPQRDTSTSCAWQSFS